MDPNYNQFPQPGQYPQQSYNEAPAKKGHSMGMLIALAIFVVLFLLAAIMWLMTASKYSDLKNNFDQKVATANEESAKEISAKKDAELAEKEKSPYETYQTPAAFGSVKIVYPKTWSAFVTENADTNIPVKGYFHPGFVPGVQSGIAFALNLEVTEADYADLLKKYESDSKSGKVKVSPYQSGNATGARIDGEIDNKKRGSIVLLPLRDKTIKLTAESEQFVNDFNEIILKNLTFVP